MFHFSKQISTARQNAFTLVELLVVIAIIGILASLAAVGVMKVLERSKMVALRLELGQLEAAVSAAKLDLGNVDELPSRIYLVNNIADFSSQLQLTGETPGITGTWELRKKTWLTIQKVFGRNVGKHPTTGGYYYYPNPMNTSTTLPVIISWPATEKKTIEGMEAYMFWIGGKRANGSFSGFSTDKRDPCETTALKRKGPYFDFDAVRVRDGNNHLTYVNSWDGEYAYFSNSFYNYYIKIPPVTMPPTPLSPKTGGDLYPYKNGNVFFNAKTFQLISSGQDQLFGSGDVYTPPFLIGDSGYDDLANFSSTQLGKKDE